jgi:glycosyltransferase involved in cell wall biosynthesis
MQETIQAPSSRNSPCPCGSGLRYKDCHGAVAASGTVPAKRPTGTPSAVFTIQPTRDVYSVLNQALAAQTAGDLVNAERLYRDGLAINPLNFDGLHMLGVVLMSAGRNDEALAMLERAQNFAPENAAVRHNLSLAQENRNLIRRMPAAFEAIERAAKWTTNPVGRVISEDDVRLIAYYLPQFHRIPENDAWWGEGFTEWTNVRRGRPNYDGHYQPHLPGELGAYDLLNDPSVRLKQAALAKAHGISGFAYYHYWFRGKRLLEQPLNEVLQTKAPDFPFCVFWANESWSRRWDGGNQEVLVSQNHDAQDDRAFIEHLLPFFEDSRYIRVQGRPLLMIYRVDLFPNARATVQLWNDVCKAHGIAPPYLVKADTGASDPPMRYGFDASVEFPPHRLRALPSMELPIAARRPDHVGTVFDMRAVMAQLTQPVEPAHRHFQCVVPAWDNTARKQLDGTMFVGERPDLFRAWTRNALVRSTRVHPPGERLVFVNAWNEWAEGAHLEPCAKFGRQWLEAARDARTLPASFQPIETLTDTLVLEALSRGDDSAFAADELVNLAALYRRRLDLPNAVNALRQALDRATTVAPKWIAEFIAITDLFPKPNLAAAFENVATLRRSRAQARKLVDEPLVSVLLPSYGHAKYVAEALRSVFAQTYRNIELIVIDDGSKDESVAVIEAEIAHVDLPVRFIARENRGAHTTINEALSLANGAYINILNSDDCFAPDRIAQFVDSVHRAGALWGYAITEFIDEQSLPLSPVDARARPLHELMESAKQNHRHSVAFVRGRGNPAISTGNLFASAEFMRRLGGFTDLRYVHDWEFCLRACLIEEPVLLHATLYRYRFHGRNTIFENEAVASTESSKVLTEYVRSANAIAAPENPLAWSRSVDGAVFGALHAQRGELSALRVEEAKCMLDTLIAEHATQV